MILKSRLLSSSYLMETTSRYENYWMSNVALKNLRLEQFSRDKSPQMERQIWEEK